MPTYTTYGGLDDRILKDGDVGFVGFNNRLRPDQLQTGFLADAQNIRLDRNGEAQVRKGTDLVLAPLATAEAVIALPFTLIADDASVTVTQTAGALVITNVTATNFVTGTQVNLSGVTGISPDPNGNRVAIRNSSSQITIQDQTYSGTAGGTATVKFNILNDSAVNAIYGSTGFSDPAAAGSQYIVIAANNKAFAVNLSTQATTQLDYPAGVSISQPVDMIQAFNKVFIFRDGETALEWDGNFSNEFTKVASGTYTQPVPLSLSDIDYASGIATATASTAAVATLLVGDTLTFTDAGSSTYSVGDTITVQTIPNTTTFTFSTDKADSTNKSGTVQKRVSVGLGFSHMPAPPFAVYHQRRLVMPFKNSVDSGADSFTSRGILDEIIASDLLDSDTYDQIFGSYRFNAGTADFVVGLHSFTDDTLMVFNRNSIHIVKNTIDLNNSTIQLLTDEVGCLARNSIQQVGNRVLFLSDNGVYGTEFLDEYNLRGTQTPLSEPINETIKRINKVHADKAVSAYFDNRYFIAVPLDDATQNNAVLIFNFLNNQWESIDSVNDPNFHTANLIVAGEGSTRGVYSVNDIGGLHRIDARADGTDRVITQIGGAQQNLLVPASLTTRQFTYGTLERKRFKEFEIHVESSDTNTSDFDISAEVENPDSTEALGSLNSFNGGDLAVNEDVSIRGRIGGLRGYGVQYTINNTSGRPRIRAIESSASDAFRSTKKAI
jgi:hypothetical protein